MTQRKFTRFEWPNLPPLLPDYLFFGMVIGGVLWAVLR